ncbi:uncharacterized protein LOC122066684 [Macadamia integrifolia]|uniref:uncharacterized protein LOC122066684 n=1 Tax=Macadamia integrifolia TaxID=60698 RepID=UPI001C4ED17D|nr:uncharacterized protein LOC122066684 [Macadamia integrifolia]
MIRERIKIALSWQKSYADNKRKPIEFVVGEKVFLKISPIKGIKRFGKGDPSHVLSAVEPLELDDDLSYEEQPKGIYDRKEYQFRSQTISYVNIKWKNHSEQEASWEKEDEVKDK